MEQYGESYGNSAAETTDADPYVGRPSTNAGPHQVASAIPPLGPSAPPRPHSSPEVMTTTRTLGQYPSRSTMGPSPSIPANSFGPASTSQRHGNHSSGGLSARRVSTPASYMEGSIMGLGPSIFHEQSFASVGPAESISQHRGAVANLRSGYTRHVSTGMDIQLPPGGDISIRTSATDGSVTSGVARDGGIPHPLRTDWPEGQSVLTSIPGSFTRGPSANRR